MGPVVKGPSETFFPWSTWRSLPRPLSLCIYILQRALPEFIWSHPQDDHGRCVWVPTPQPTVLPAYLSAGGGQGRKNPSKGWTENSGLCYCFVQGTRQECGPREKQTQPCPDLSLTSSGSLDMSLNLHSFI